MARQATAATLEIVEVNGTVAVLVAVDGVVVVVMQGEFDADTCTVECPRHGSLFDLTTGRPKTLPAFAPVQTFTATVVDDTITLEVD